MIVKKYSKIKNLETTESLLFSLDVVVLEKIHGTNIRIGKVDGQFIVGSKNNNMFDGEYHKKFDGYGTWNWIQENNIQDKNLPDNTIFMGEFFGAGVAKEIKYFDPELRKKHFVVFDVFVDGTYIDHDDVIDLSMEYDFDTVPYLYSGSGITIEKLNELRNMNSKLAWENGIDTISEGIVIKPAKETRDHRDNRVIAKFKSDKYAEKSKTRTPRVPKERSKYFSLGYEYCTFGRVENCIDKLRQEINEELNLQHIPKLLGIMKEDILKDADNVPSDKDELKDFIKGSIFDTAKYYKEWLIKSG